MGRSNLRKRQERRSKSKSKGARPTKSFVTRPPKLSYKLGGFKRPPREMHKAICSECGKECEVPFKPDGRRPVYCRECFNKRREY